ncbi:MAG: hypothetical protein IJW24_01675, partial [Clostridia bacterium]|nr:hypothetical protein [Clostridia bacterium]
MASVREILDYFKKKRETELSQSESSEENKSFKEGHKFNIGLAYRKAISEKIARAVQIESESLQGYLKQMAELPQIIKSQEDLHTFVFLFTKLKNLNQNATTGPLGNGKQDQEFETEIDLMISECGAVTPEVFEAKKSELEAKMSAFAKKVLAEKSEIFEFCPQDVTFEYEKLPQLLSDAIKRTPAFTEIFSGLGRKVTEADMNQFLDLTVQTFNDYFASVGVSSGFSVETRHETGEDSTTRGGSISYGSLGNSHIEFYECLKKSAQAEDKVSMMMQMICTASHEYGHSIDHFLNREERKQQKRGDGEPIIQNVDQMVVLSAFSPTVEKKLSELIGAEADAKEGEKEENNVETFVHYLSYLQYFDQECEQNARNFSGFVANACREEFITFFEKSDPLVARAFEQMGEDGVVQIMNVGECKKANQRYAERDAFFKPLEQDLSIVQDMTKFEKSLSEALENPDMI